MEEETPKERSWPKLPETLSQTVDWMGDLASNVLTQGTDLFQQGAIVSKDLVLKAAEKSEMAIGSVQRKLGEDYYAILEANSLVRETLARKELNSDLLATAFNVPWTSTLLWSVAAGSAVCFEQPVSRFLQGLIHDGPGHWKRWDEVNRFMDNVGGQFMAGATGSGHRLKFGHSVEYLPQIIERFGIESTPAFFVHLLQDAATVHGIPVVPQAWDLKQALHAVGLSRKVATGLISVNYSGLLAAIAIVKLIDSVWEMGSAAVKKAKAQSFLKTAATAFQHNDYIAAVENYQRALEIERSPLVLMALGQVYMQRAINRLRAHQAFTEAVIGLASQPNATIFYHHAQISVRGMAGLQALATADVLAEIHPEHWNDHVKDLVNATVFSFSATAQGQAKEGESLMADRVFAPAHFSAALNFYLAAKAASYCPFVEEQRAKVIQNTRSALRSLGLMVQHDEACFRQPASVLGELWTNELLLTSEVETALATY